MHAFEGEIFMARYKIIVNPAAGRGAAGKAVPRMERLLEKADLDFDVVETEGPWHAAELALKAVDMGDDVVVAMGGDGTANEVLNGLMQAKEAGKGSCTMGVLCVGRGNDFAYGVGIPTDLEEGCRILTQGSRRTIDVGWVVGDGVPRGRYFGNGIGIGFDAVVGFEAAKMKRLHGFLCYAVSALKTLFLYYKAPLVQIEYNGKTMIQFSLMISVMNGQRMGGGFKMAAHARPDDGQLDLCIAGVASRLRILGLMFHFMRGTQAGKKPIKTDRTARITVTALEGSLPAHADGETLCVEGHRLELELLAEQMDIICPPIC